MVENLFIGMEEQSKGNKESWQAHELSKLSKNFAETSHSLKILQIPVLNLHSHALCLLHVSVLWVLSKSPKFLLYMDVISLATRRVTASQYSEAEQ